MNKELREKIARLEAELAEVKEMAEGLKSETDDGGVFKPKGRQKYWFISESGEVYQSMWCNDWDDNERHSIGNIYTTKQSAEDTVRALKLIQKARESQDGFVPDWEDDTQDKYCLSFGRSGIFVADYTLVNPAPTFGYWEDESVCEQFIDENSDDLRWFFTEYRR